MDFDAYFHIQAERIKDEKQANLLKTELINVLVPFYEACLKDRNTSSNIAGFIIADIDKYPFLTPDAELVRQTRKSLEDRAAQYVRQEKNPYSIIKWPWYMVQSAPC